MPKPELWISVDVEADGPIPGPCSMVSVGACVAGTYGDSFTPIDPDAHTFYAELQPISEDFDPEALAVSGLTREHLVQHGRPPGEAMLDLVEWIQATRAELRTGPPVFCAYPLGYDWLMVYWYLMRFVGRSPFSHGRHLDMKTLYAARAGAPVSQSVKREMPAHLLGDRPHTHNALDDAKGQADLLVALMAWDGSR